MNNVWALASTLLLLCGPHSLLHAEASEPSVNKRFSVGPAVGYHDADTDDSADPHVNGYTYSLLVGYDWSRYVACDAEVTHMNRGSDLDVFGRRLSFGADVDGGGVRGDYWFAEFVSYGKLDDLYLDQVRAGLILRF
jgi:hypothetical protein